MIKKSKVNTKAITAFVYKGSYRECNCWDIAFKNGATKFYIRTHVKSRFRAKMYARLGVIKYRRRLVKIQPFTIV